MKVAKIKLITVQTVALLFLLASCGQRQSQTADAGNEGDDPQQEEKLVIMDEQALRQPNIQSIAQTLVELVPEINEKYDGIYSSENNGGYEIDDKHYLYRYTMQDAEQERRKLQMYWYEQKNATNDWVLVSYVDGSIKGFLPWLKCFSFDRKTGTLKETELPFTIPPAQEFDKKEFQKDQTYLRTDYTICENGNVVIAVATSKHATCFMLCHWDKKGSFTLYKRGVNTSHKQRIEDDANAEKYVQNVILPNYQRIKAINKWAWTEKKDVWDLSLEGASLTYYYSKEGLEKIVASLAGEYYSATYEYYFLNRYLSFIISTTNSYPDDLYSPDFNPDEAEYTLKERKWYIQNGFCFRGVGNDDKKLSSDEVDEGFGYEGEYLFGKIMGK